MYIFDLKIYEILIQNIQTIKYIYIIKYNLYKII